MDLGHLKNNEVHDEGQVMIHDKETDLNETQLLCQYLEIWSLFYLQFLLEGSK